MSFKSNYFFRKKVGHNAYYIPYCPWDSNITRSWQRRRRLPDHLINQGHSISSYSRRDFCAYDVQPLMSKNATLSKFARIKKLFVEVINHGNTL